MEYEAYEPDPQDEYYDQMCSAVYADMFNRRDAYAYRYECDSEPFWTTVIP